MVAAIASVAARTSPCMLLLTLVVDGKSVACIICRGFNHAACHRLPVRGGTPLREARCRPRANGTRVRVGRGAVYLGAVGWAASSVGRAPRSQRGGREFEPPAVHQISLANPSVPTVILVLLGLVLPQGNARWICR